MDDLKIYSSGDFPEYLPKLNALYDELFSGGKGFRAKLTQSVSNELGLAPEATQLLCQTIEFIHNSSLLHDDLVDRSTLRRGKTAAWLKYSPEYAVLAGDYLLARVMVNLSDYGNVDLIRATSQCISDLLEGEWLQDALVGERDVSLRDLDRVHRLKTSSLFKWCLMAPFMATEKDSTEVMATLSELGNTLGVLFQRGDDLLDFDIRNDEGKIVLGDLKSKYVNSFCSFVFNDLDTANRDRALQAQDLDEFINCVGHDHFTSCHKRFDQLNQDLIDGYLRTVGELKPQLSDQSVCDILAELPAPLYWRRAN